MHADLTQSRFARQVALMQKIGDAVQWNHSNSLFCHALAVIVYFLFAKQVILPKGFRNPCSFRMDKKTLSDRDVEDNNHSLSDGMQQALKGVPIACLLIDKRVKA
jgi:hypothetical protein